MNEARKKAWAGTIDHRAQRHRDKREAILRMAARMFATEGYAATSLAAIAERLNVTKPTLYYYVKNKEEILHACVEAGVKAVNQNLAEAHATGTDGYKKLSVFFHLHVDFILDDFGALLVAARQDLTHKHRRRLKSVDRAVVELIDEGMSDGSIESREPKIVCFILFGAFNAIPTWFDENGAMTRTEIVDTYFEILLNGIATT